mgnify:CR=1 FL=1
MSWPMYRHVERRASRLHEMLDALDVDAASLARLQSGEAYAEARRRCVLCGTGDQCLLWLDQPGRRHQRPQFCPSLPLFETCRRTAEIKTADR